MVQKSDTRKTSYSRIPHIQAFQSQISNSTIRTRNSIRTSASLSMATLPENSSNNNMASSSSDNITQSRTSSSSSSGLEPKETFTSEKSLLPKTTEQVDVPRHWHCRRNEEVEGRILTEADLGDKNPKNFKLRLKVAIILVTALVQISMNLNASIFGNAYSGLQEKYGFTNDRCRLFTALFLIAYAFGCELCESNCVRAMFSRDKC